MRGYSRDELKAMIRPLTANQEASLGYLNSPLADLCTVATPDALLIRARSLRTHDPVDKESVAAHLELAAETISLLWRFL